MATGIQNTIMSSDKLDMLKQIPIALSYEGKQPEDKIYPKT